MQETPPQPQAAAQSLDKQAAPQGIGMAVAFDWGLTVEMLLIPIFLIFLRAPAQTKEINMNSQFSTILSFLLLWPAALLFALFGEGIRRGVRWTRPVQIVGNTLGFLAGWIVLVPSWNQIKAGHYWSLVVPFILLVFSPLIAWRLSRPSTRQWFATVTSPEARKRHGGLWLWEIALWSIVGGTLVVLSIFF